MVEVMQDAKSFDSTGKEFEKTNVAPVAKQLQEKDQEVIAEKKKKSRQQCTALKMSRK